MKRNLALILAAAIALGAAPAFAEHGGPHGPGPGGPGGPGGHGGPGMHFFEESDTNKDGFLTKEEMREAQEKRLNEMFEKLDTDKDGKLSKEELQKGHAEMRKKMRQHFKEMKAKKDAEKAAQ